MLKNLDDGVVMLIIYSSVTESNPTNLGRSSPSPDVGDSLTANDAVRTRSRSNLELSTMGARRPLPRCSLRAFPTSIVHGSPCSLATDGAYHRSREGEREQHANEKEKLTFADEGAKVILNSGSIDGV